MARERKMTWIAADGTEWPTQAEAETCDHLYAAKCAYRDAAERYHRALLETQRTADDIPFDLARWGDYWYIKDVFGFPDCHRVRFYPQDVRVHSNIAEVTVTHNAASGERCERTYKIGELYASERAVREELLQRQIEAVRVYGEQVAELRSKLAAAESLRGSRRQCGGER